MSSYSDLTRNDKREIFFMRKALQVAEHALNAGEVPVGCVVVWNGAIPLPNGKSSFQEESTEFDYVTSKSVIISHGANQVNATRDATRHAECVAIDRVLSDGMISDKNRLPQEVIENAYPQSSNSFPDIWLNIPDFPTHWKNSYGWGSNKLFNRNQLRECDLYVTVEPCIMCAAALAKVGIRRVFFGCKNSRFGGNGSLLNLHHESAIISESHLGYEIIPGILEQEAIDLLRRFYDRENLHAPDEKRKRK